MKTQEGFLGPAVVSALGAGQSPLASAVSRLIVASGGIEGLIRKFREHGLMDVIQSWISNGANRPIGEKQIEAIFGRSEVDQVAGEAGISRETLLQQMTRALPSIVDTLTPAGRLPAILKEDEIKRTGLEWLKSALH